MADHIYLEYQIVLDSKEDVAEEQATPVRIWWPRNSPSGSIIPYVQLGVPLYGAGYIFMAPDRATSIYSAPIRMVGEAVGNAPHLVSAWFTAAALAVCPTDEDSFERRGDELFGGQPKSLKKIHWVGYFVYKANQAEIDDVPPVGGSAIMQRRWIDGFELPAAGEGGGMSDLGTHVSRDASRHHDGYGLAMRGEGTSQKTHTVNENDVALTPIESWERFYIRIRQLPTAATAFWRCESTASSGQGMELQISPSGQIGLYNVTAALARVLLVSTPALVVDRWYRIDCLFQFGLAAFFRLYLNRVESVVVTSFPAGVGMAAVGTHVRSGMGVGLGDNALGLDVDDWICAALPVTLDGLDWLNGSRIVRIDANGFGPGHNAAAWAASGAQWQSLEQRPSEDVDNDALSVQFRTTTSGATLEVTTDAVRKVNEEPQAVGGGFICFTVGLASARVGAADGQLGYSLNGAAFTMATIAQQLSIAWDAVMFRPAGLVAPVPFTSLLLRYVKGATVDQSDVNAMGACAEILGQWGPEDPGTEPTVGTPAAVGALTGIHNAPYWQSIWSRLGVPPISPVIIVGGTYVGNGTVVELPFRGPVNFFWTRRVTAAVAAGNHWWSSKVVSQQAFTQAGKPSGVVRADRTPGFVPGVGDATDEYIVRIIGGEAGTNEAGITYQYVAVIDPGMRFMINGALRYHKGTGDQSTTLWKPAFQAHAAFFQRLDIASATVAYYFKGPGHAAQGVSIINGSEVASALQMNAGSLLSRSAFHANVAEVNFNLWRRDDGSSDPGRTRVMQTVSYVGDGLGSRTIGLTPASERRPMFAIIQASNAAAFQRDPSHTGTTSTQLNPQTANAATGIIAGGIDQITVGSALNANGITYTVFNIPGDSVAGNNGWSPNGEFEPVEPDIPVDWPGLGQPPGDPTTFEPDEDPGGGGSPGTGGPPGDDFGTQCVAASTRLINRALGMLGVSQQIVDVVNETSVEAALARLNYDEVVQMVIRDHPWPCFTLRASLVLVVGSTSTPANDDWQFGYRIPADCIYCRRLIKPGSKRAYDADPIPFRFESGDLLYTDVAPAVLEYTFRPTCAAGLGDALFRDALMWRVAHTLAPALARDQKKVDRCWSMYLQCLDIARTKQEREQLPQDNTSGGDAPWIADR